MEQEYKEEAIDMSKYQLLAKGTPTEVADKLATLEYSAQLEVTISLLRHTPNDYFCAAALEQGVEHASVSVATFKTAEDMATALGDAQVAA